MINAKGFLVTVETKGNDLIMTHRLCVGIFKAIKIFGVCKPQCIVVWILLSDADLCAYQPRLLSRDRFGLAWPSITLDLSALFASGEMNRLAINIP